MWMHACVYDGMMQVQANNFGTGSSVWMHVRTCTQAYPCVPVSIPTPMHANDRRRGSEGFMV